MGSKCETSKTSDAGGRTFAIATEPDALFLCGFDARFHFCKNASFRVPSWENGDILWYSEGILISESVTRLLSQAEYETYLPQADEVWYAWGEILGALRRS